MSRKPENVYAGGIIKLLPDVHTEKTNNPYRSGMADYWLSGDLSDAWIEFKYLPRTPKKPFTPKCTALQLQWLGQRYDEGRQVYVIVGCPTGGVIFKDRQWELEISHMEYGMRLQQKEAVARWIKRLVGVKSCLKINLEKF